MKDAGAPRHPLPHAGPRRRQRGPAADRSRSTANGESPAGNSAKKIGGAAVGGAILGGILGGGKGAAIGGATGAAGGTAAVMAGDRNAVDALAPAAS